VNILLGPDDGRAPRRVFRIFRFIISAEIVAYKCSILVHLGPSNLNLKDSPLKIPRVLNGIPRHAIPKSVPSSPFQRESSYLATEDAHPIHPSAPPSTTAQAQSPETDLNPPSPHPPKPPPHTPSLDPNVRFAESPDGDEPCESNSSDEIYSAIGLWIPHSGGTPTGQRKYHTTDHVLWVRKSRTWAYIEGRL
jgi:hypothetical protein